MVMGLIGKVAAKGVGLAVKAGKSLLSAFKGKPVTSMVKAAGGGGLATIPSAVPKLAIAGAAAATVAGAGVMAKIVSGAAKGVSAVVGKGKSVSTAVMKIPPRVSLPLLGAGGAIGAVGVSKMISERGEMPGGGVFQVTPPQALGAGLSVAYSWNTGTATFYRLTDGRIAVQRKNGVWKVWRPARHIVVSRNPRTGTLIRADKRIDRLMKGLMRRMPAARVAQRPKRKR